MSSASAEPACGEEEAREVESVVVSKLQGMAPAAIHAYISGASWHSAVNVFLDEGCVEFSAFEVGMEYTWAMTKVHMKFQETLEILLEGELTTLCMDPECFVAVLQQQAGTDEADAITGMVEDVVDFLKFGTMMRKRFEYNKVPVFKHVRVLWDIENFEPQTLHVEAAALALQSFLEDRGYGGHGVNVSVTAFYSLDLVSKAFVKALDRATVKQVVCTDKREDADRKINDAFPQDAVVLDPGFAAFVLVTSDSDFKTLVQQAKAKGFHVAVVHDAQPDTSCALSLCQHATRSFEWSDVQADHLA